MLLRGAQYFHRALSRRHGAVSAYRNLSEYDLRLREGDLDRDEGRLLDGFFEGASSGDGGEA